MDPAVLRQEVSQVKWFHTIDLGNGIVTPGQYDNRAALRILKLPSSLEGMSVLDIGAWDGFYSFEVERRGASRVLATDSFSWGGGGWGTKAGFDLAKRALNSKVEEMEIDVMDISPSNVGVFDVALFLGVLYHLRHPLMALERVASVTKKLLVVETHLDKIWEKRPVMAFYPGSELDNDPTNWWGPNPAAVEAMLKDVGFSKVARMNMRPSLPRMLYQRIRLAKRKRHVDFLSFQQMRGVFHAWK